MRRTLREGGLAPLRGVRESVKRRANRQSAPSLNRRVFAPANAALAINTDRWIIDSLASSGHLMAHDLRARATSHEPLAEFLVRQALRPGREQVDRFVKTANAVASRGSSLQPLDPTLVWPLELRINFSPEVWDGPCWSIQWPHSFWDNLGNLHTTEGFEAATLVSDVLAQIAPSGFLTTREIAEECAWTLEEEVDTLLEVAGDAGGIDHVEEQIRRFGAPHPSLADTCLDGSSQEYLLELCEYVANKTDRARWFREGWGDSNGVDDILPRAQAIDTPVSRWAEQVLKINQMIPDAQPEGACEAEGDCGYFGGIACGVFPCMEWETLSGTADHAMNVDSLSLACEQLEPLMIASSMMQWLLLNTAVQSLEECNVVQHP